MRIEPQSIGCALNLDTVMTEVLLTPLLLLFIILMLAIYNYVPQTHHVCTVRTAAAILQLQFMLHVMLLLLLLFIILMLAIYNYVPQTQHVCTACSINYSCSYSAATVYATCIIIIIYHLNAGYLQLCTTNTPCLYSTYCCSYSAATVYVTCNVISNVECSALLHYHFPQCVCSAKYG